MEFCPLSCPRNAHVACDAVLLGGAYRLVEAENSSRHNYNGPHNGLGLFAVFLFAIACRVRPCCRIPTSFKLHDNAGAVPACAPDISGDLPAPGASPDDAGYDRFAIPSLADLGVEPPLKALRFRGGEREALSRFQTVMVSVIYLEPCSASFGIRCACVAR